MFIRFGAWLGRALESATLRLGERETRRSLKMRVEALCARAADDSRRLREQQDEIMRLRAIVRQYADATADAVREAARENVRIRQAQEEIRRLSELRR